MEPPRSQPYVGPRPFQRGEDQIFSGRDAEAHLLVSMVIAHSTTLVFGHTGTGKSSLINAAVIPLLEAEATEVLPITRFQEPPPVLDPPAHVNVYTFNTLTCWDQERSDPSALAAQSLGDFLARNKGISLGDNDSPRLRVAIFDQFEEIFTRYPAHWQDRRQFFTEIRDALEGDRLLRVVFLMREDYIGELDPYVDILPDKLRNRFRLEHLNQHSALAALTAPLATTDRYFAAGVAEQLIDDLLAIRIRSDDGWDKVRGQYVEPLHLQVVAQNLWESLGYEEKTITKAYIERSGDVETALTGFYESTIHSVTTETGTKEGVLRLWFENSLITPLGTRGVVYREEERTAGIPNQVVDLLVARRLLRVELRGGGIWFELVHDRFIQPIRDSNRQWLLDHGGDDPSRRRLQKKTEEWVRAGRPETVLLDAGELLEANRWIRSAEVEVAYSQDLLLLVSRSQAAMANRMLKLRRILAAVFGLLFLWALVVTLLLFLRKY